MAVDKSVAKACFLEKHLQITGVDQTVLGVLERGCWSAIGAKLSPVGLRCKGGKRTKCRNSIKYSVSAICVVEDFV